MATSAEPVVVPSAAGKVLAGTSITPATFVVLVSDLQLCVMAQVMLRAVADRVVVGVTVVRGPTVPAPFLVTLVMSTESLYS